MTNMTTYERFSHEGAVARKKKKRYIEKLKKQKEAHRASINSSKSSTGKFKEKESTGYDNIRTSNTITEELLEDDEFKQNDEDNNPSIISLRGKYLCFYIYRLKTYTRG